MSIPRAAPNSVRSAFAVIDPVTEEYHRIAEPSNASKLSLTKRYRNFFAISYVWSDWKESPADSLPSWDRIRNRLLQLTTTNIAATVDANGAGGGLLSSVGPPEAFKCWIDCKCIDQASPADKAFWVPRMNQVFYDACCTILLLRDLDLTGLYELFRITKCMFLDAPGHARSTNELSQHRCLFAPNCISLTAPIPAELELLCLQTIEALWNGEWRKRAWVFQEILLSERYVLSWGDSSSVAYIELETVGYIAAFLHSRHPDMSWLTDFWVWCKQCSYLRQFYSEKCEMEATILQLAENLEASVPCDKYYALCGILDLDSVPYNPNHSAEQALDNVISALTRQGRMGWIYAVPPTMQREGILFSSQHMAPFMLTKKKQQMSTIESRECFFSSSFIGLNVVEQGSIITSTEFAVILRQLQNARESLSHEYMTSRGRQGFLKSYYQGLSPVLRRFASILFRLAYDTINHFRDRNLLNILFRSLDRWGLHTNLLDDDPECCFWYTITTLCFIEARSVESIDDGFSREVVRRSAQEIQRVCAKLDRQGWQIVEWQRPMVDTKGSSTSKIPETKLAAYCGVFPVQGQTVWSLQTKRSSKSLLFIASDHSSKSPTPTAYLGTPSPSIGYGQSLWSLSQDYKVDPSAKMGMPMLNVSSLRSELSDTALTFFGVAHQINSSLGLSNLSQNIYHDDPDENLDSTMRALRKTVKSRFKLSTDSGSSKTKNTKFLNFQRKLTGTTAMISGIPTPRSGTPISSGPAYYSSYSQDMSGYTPNDLMSGGLVDRDIPPRNPLSPFTVPPSPYSPGWEMPRLPASRDHTSPPTYYSSTSTPSGDIGTAGSSESHVTNLVFEMDGSSALPVELDATNAERPTSSTNNSPRASGSSTVGNAPNIPSAVPSSQPHTPHSRPPSDVNFEPIPMHESGSPVPQRGIEGLSREARRLMIEFGESEQRSSQTQPFSQQRFDQQVEIRVSQFLDEAFRGANEPPAFHQTTMPQADALREVFPLVETAVIEKLLLKHPNNLDAVIEECERKQDNLSLKYPSYGLPSSTNGTRQRNASFSSTSAAFHRTPSSPLPLTRPAQSISLQTYQESVSESVSPDPAGNLLREAQTQGESRHRDWPSTEYDTSKDKGKGKAIASPIEPFVEQAMTLPVEPYMETHVGSPVIPHGESRYEVHAELPGDFPPSQQVSAYDEISAKLPVDGSSRQATTGRLRPGRPIVPPKPKRLMGQRSKSPTSSPQSKSPHNRSWPKREGPNFASDETAQAQSSATQSTLGSSGATVTSWDENRVTDDDDDDFLIDLREDVSDVTTTHRDTRLLDSHQQDLLSLLD